VNEKDILAMLIGVANNDSFEFTKPSSY